ncbi:MAG: hypothetical protein ACOCP4_04115 [Candidatus Woesearchaeota archaeon]
MPKKITVKSVSPIAAHRWYETLWDDVFLSWSCKPGRSVYKIAPMIGSRKDLEYQYEDMIKLQKNASDYDYSKEINDIKKALDYINSYNKIYIENPNDPITEIYTPREYIDKNEAEKMISELMKHYGFNEIRCKWKRPKMFVIST